MISQAGSSLLAAQIYGSAANQVSARNDAPVRRPDFEQAAKEARDLKATATPARSFPVDRVELRQMDESPLAKETALALQEEAASSEVEDARRFAREAPGTEPRYLEAPGSRLDISV